MNPLFYLFTAFYIAVSSTASLQNTPPELVVENNNASMVHNGVTIAKTHIAPERTIVDEQTKKDRAYLLANCMVVVRDIHALGPFCHVPSVRQVEVYTTKGDTIIYNHNSNLRGIVGEHFTSNFLYGGRTSPDGDWGLITGEAEGRLYGFTILNNDGLAKDYLLPYDMDMGYSEEPKFVNGNYTISLIEYPEKEYVLTIQKNGEYEIKEKS